MKMKKLLSAALLLALLLSLCACGGSSKGSGNNMESAAQFSAAADMAAAAPMEAPAPDVAEEEFAGLEMKEALDAGLGAGTAGASGAGGEAKVDPEKIIYSADVTVETTAFDDAVAEVTRLVEDYSGWVESSSVNDANYYSRARGYVSSRSASYTLRIPSEKFSAFMSGLSELGNVPYTHTYTENVTAQYYDVQARLTAYTTQETRLLEMMEQAETVSDVIAIEEKLTELRYQIESLQSTLNNYDRRVSYSSVYLTLEEVQEYTPETEQQIGFGRQLVLALQRGGRSFVNGCRELILTVASILPGLLLLGLCLCLTVWGVRKRRAKKKARKASAPPEQSSDLPKQ